MFHLDHMFLDTFRIAAAQNAEQLIVRDEEESREGVPFGVEVIVQRFLTFLQTTAQVLQVGQSICGVTRLFDVRRLGSVVHDL